MISTGSLASLSQTMGSQVDRSSDSVGRGGGVSISDLVGKSRVQRFASVARTGGSSTAILLKYITLI